MITIMKHFNRLASVFCVAFLGLLMLTGCEGDKLYEVGAPGWLENRIDSAKNAKNPGKGLYSVGLTDFTSPFFTLGKSHVIPAEGVWEAELDLTVNPDNVYFKNFYVVITNDVSIEPRGAGYQEYGVIRFDNDPSKNSEWGGHIDRSLITANFTNTSGADDIDPNSQLFNGRVKVTVDRTGGGLVVKFSNDKLEKTYTQTTPLVNLNSDPTNTNIRCTLGVDHSYFTVVSSNIDPVDDTLDHEPVSITAVNNLPSTMMLGEDLMTVMEGAGVTATVAFDGGISKTVSAGALKFQLLPDAETEGDKTLVVMYDKTYNDKTAASPVATVKTIKLTGGVVSIEVVTQPTMTTYENVFGEGYPFVPAGMVVKATYTDGTTGQLEYSKMQFSPVPAQVGTHEITITAGKGKATVNVTVNSVIETDYVHITPQTIGALDNSGGWWTAHSDDVLIPAGKTYSTSFTNYSKTEIRWQNFSVVLCNGEAVKVDNPNYQEYVVLRADNAGWGNGWDACTHDCTQGPDTDPRWDTWRLAMDGARCSIYVKNNGDGTVDAYYVMVGNTGEMYWQTYKGVNNIPADKCYLDFTVDMCHIVFD